LAVIVKHYVTICVGNLNLVTSHLVRTQWYYLCTVSFEWTFLSTEE